MASYLNIGSHGWKGFHHAKINSIRSYFENYNHVIGVGHLMLFQRNSAFAFYHSFWSFSPRLLLLLLFVLYWYLVGWIFLVWLVYFFITQPRYFSYSVVFLKKNLIFQNDILRIYKKNQESSITKHPLQLSSIFKWNAKILCK